MTKSTPDDGDDASSSSSSSSSSPQRRLPWLMLSPEPNRPNLRRFFNLETRETVWVPVPDAVASHETYCLSSNGWLLTFSGTLFMSLINPIKRVSIPLPYGGDGSLDDFDEWFDNNVTYKFYIAKFALSNDLQKDDNFCAAIVYGDVGKVAIWKKGDDAWTRVVYDEDGKQLRAFKDIVYYRGEFYVLKLGMSGRIFAFGVDTDRGEVRARLVADVSKSDHFPASFSGNYLVVSGGKLLLVFRDGDENGENDHDVTINNDIEDVEDDGDEDVEEYDDHDNNDNNGNSRDQDEGALEGWNANGFLRTNKFQILRLSNLDKEDGGLELLDDLGDESLFLGSNQSISIKASECPGCKTNCIYFTDDWYDIWPSGKGAGRDMGIFHLQTNTIEPYYQVNDSFISFITPMWVEPS